MRTYCPVARLCEHVGEMVVTCGLVVEQWTHHQITGEPMQFGSGTIWWGEATDEPARADARPTGKFKLYHYLKFLTLADWTGMVETELFAQTYKSHGLATVRYPVLEITAMIAGRVEAWRRRNPFENGRGFSLRVLRTGKARLKAPHQT